MAIKVINGLTTTYTLSSEEKLESSGTYTGLIRDSIDEAIRLNASDIHFEPTEKGFVIRHRICGNLKLFFNLEESKDIKMPPEILKNGITTTLKSISNIPLGRQNVAQDSGVSLPKRGVDIRVNKMPTIYGEKFVYRLFDKNQSTDLTKIGLTPQSLKDVIAATNKKSGLIIITSETGSGKTSTIYSMIEAIDRGSLNVSTLENPVERNLKGVNHTAVNDSFSFADGLRALMRQDPDVIVVGEIRDEVTAKLAVRAASTGHLVISTMHTNTALNIPMVFEYYGADKLQMMRSLILGANQRLVKRICQNCALSTENGFKRANEKGCRQCFSGFENKRELLFEYFTSEQIKENMELGLKVSMNEIFNNLAKKGVIDEREIYRQGSLFNSDSA